MTSCTIPRLPHLSPLIDALDRVSTDSDWSPTLSAFVDSPAALLGGLAADLARLSPQEFQPIAAKSREVNTHYAWCLFDERTLYSIWINEYKPPRDWLRGHANVVHNHRYSFCGAILKGQYTEELFSAVYGTDSELIVNVSPLNEFKRATGSVRTVKITEFHRIPTVADGTMSLLVKSTASRPYGISFDLESGLSRKHVPIEQRQRLLVERLA